MPKRWIALLLALMTSSVFAQMPHEVLLLVNKQSAASMLTANTYVEARKIPRRNVVYLDVPEHLYSGSATVTPEEFTWLIWEPAKLVVKERGLEDQILAWVYSVDFPIRVETDSNDRKQMSVAGMTFMRNKPPSMSMVEEGKFLSKLFAGPNERLKVNLNAMSLGMRKRGLGPEAEVPPETPWLRDGLGEKAPLPSMSLGYIGEKGNDIDTVLATIGRGLRSDHRGPRGGVYFVATDDVRSKCREWQFYPAVNELGQRGIKATVTTNFPAGASDVMGVLMGAETVDTSKIKSFAPGAMAEHLTSWSAEFQKPQTKMTDWLKAGATGSAGAVVEPYSNPNKFPSARFFVMYASGCTMLESFYQSIACPLQSLLIGDPLAKPYAVPIGLKILGADSIENDFTYLAAASAPVGGAEFSYSFMLDGKEIQPASDKNSVHLLLNHVSDGWHELRAVARVRHLVEFSASADKPIMVNRMGRSITVSPNLAKVGKHEHALKVEIGGREQPGKIKLVSGERTLDEKVFAADAELVLDELMLGEGPNRVRAVAVYADGMEVSSAPMTFGIKFNTGD